LSLQLKAIELHEVTARLDALEARASGVSPPPAVIAPWRATN
jgi:hypothetical protein